MDQPVKVLTLQEIFDKAAIHLLTQGKPAVTPDRNKCKYRTDEGLKCAVGGLIPDDLYDSRIEGAAVVDCYMADPLPRDNILREILTKIGIQGKGFTLLKNLQSIHDTIHDREAGCVEVDLRHLWAAQLTQLAKANHLNYDVVINFRAP